MEIEDLPQHIVYSPQVIDFVTIAAEMCLFLEHSTEITTTDFVDKGIKLSSLLYLKSVLLDIPERVFDDPSERFVTEADYEEVKSSVAVLLGEMDSYLETFHPDMALSDTPIAAFVSEHLADVYQELKDFAANYQLADVDVMNDALADCIEAFREHWGQKLLNALKALHAIRFSDDFGQEPEELSDEISSSINRNAFLGFLRDDDDVNPLL